VSALTVDELTASVPTFRGLTASAHVASRGFVDGIAGTPVAGSKVPAEPAAAGLLDTGQLASLPTAERHNEVAFSSLLVSHSKTESEPATMLSVAVAAFETRNSAPTQNSQAQPGAVEVRVGERGWDQAVGEKLVWMTNQKKQVAELHLNPPDLGPLKITITLDQSQASAQFVSAHASVREALELAMPRLREMLADSGITLGNTSVGGDSFREQAQPQPRANVTQPVATRPDPGIAVSGTRQLRHGHGLVDTFA
ncbi:MAG: flagellar hook-length control protein FliK, partial [Comamonadaceae bacterium]